MQNHQEQVNQELKKARARLDDRSSMLSTKVYSEYLKSQKDTILEERRKITEYEKQKLEKEKLRKESKLN
ncbi:hypothetical protein HK096_003490 [Nowakowskiella sp. JEL0078]|nr:hypothetical protein HK096_003490 [Nowakowskiella sp. JEL0078]